MKRNAKKKATKVVKPTAEWNFHLSNGDFLAVLTFSRAEITKLFPGAKIKNDSVYL